MKPLLVICVAFIISLTVLKLINGKYEFALAIRIAMAVMLCFTAIGHFLYTDGMVMMIPKFIPFKKEVVYLTAVIEVSAAFGLLIPKLQELTGWLLILFFVMMLPANIYGAIKNVDYQNANYMGKGIMYLWFRIPLQLFFIVSTYFGAIYKW